MNTTVNLDLGRPEFQGSARISVQAIRQPREDVPITVAPARTRSETALTDSWAFREQLLRRREAPYEPGWYHGGLNE